jgi:hypothetical protein
MKENEFILKLLLSHLRLRCRYFTGDEEICTLSEKGITDHDVHVACNCDGDISRCDLPEKFRGNL